MELRRKLRAKKLEEPPSSSKSSTTITRSSRRLNDLPEEILIHILSLLPTTLDAVRTTSVSRKWRNLCYSTPNLSFVLRRFPRSTSLSQTFDSFANFVTQTLTCRRNQNSPLPLLEFRLAIFPDVYDDLLHSWIRAAVSLNANQLDLELNDGFEDALHELANLWENGASCNEGDGSDVRDDDDDRGAISMPVSTVSISLFCI